MSHKENLTLDTSKRIALFTDGSCSTYKTKIGGWAWIAIDAFEGELYGDGAALDTTSNRMEMQAWIEGLEAIYEAVGAANIVVYSDSQYVGRGASRVPIGYDSRNNANIDLWQRLSQVIDRHIGVEFEHVKSHAGHPLNNLVHQRARQAGKVYRNLLQSTGKL